MLKAATAPGLIRRTLHRLRDAWIGDDPEPEQLSGLDILGFFGHDAYDAWRRDGCPLVTFDQLAAHRTTRQSPYDDRPDWGEISRWIDQNGRGPRISEQLRCGLCETPAAEHATFGEVLDHLSIVHEIHGALAAKLVRVQQVTIVEEISHG